VVAAAVTIVAGLAVAAVVNTRYRLSSGTSQQDRDEREGGGAGGEGEHDLADQPNTRARCAAVIAPG
jgi:hypothetical protein